MRFIISRVHLMNALNIVSKAVSNKSPLPILNGIKFELSNDQLVLLGSDTDISIKTIIPVTEKGEQIINVFETGEIVLSSRYITEIVRKIDSERIELEILDGNLVKISDQHTNFNINGIKAKDYPQIDLNPNGTLISLNAQTLKTTLNQTIFATSISETRPMLTGVNFKMDGNILECVATDTFRLAKKVIKTNESGLFNVTIPAKSLSEISKIIDNDEIVNIYFSEKKVLFKLAKTTISTRIISGVYPDTSKLIPSNQDYRLEVITSNILAAVDRASLLSTDRNNIVKLNMSQEKVEISSNSQEIGSVNERLNTFHYEGDKMSISFSAQYVQDAIKAIGSEDIQLLFVGEMKPFVIKNKEDDSITQLVVPVRTY